MNELERLLRGRLAGTLPGAQAQLRMAPSPRRGWRPGKIPPGCRDAACLVLVYPKDGDPHILLTVRSSTLGRHAGQVSLPGGEIDPGEGQEQAALREAREEVGVTPSEVRLVGRLSPLHVPVSGFVLHPVVAVSPSRPPFRCATGEVERVVELPVALLLAPDARKSERRVVEGTQLEIPFLEVDGANVWGATAMILAELACVLGAEVGR